MTWPTAGIEPNATAMLAAGVWASTGSPLRLRSRLHYCLSSRGRSGASYYQRVELRLIDEYLQRYSANERRIATNLHDLELNSTYQILTTDDLVGVTGRRLNPSLNASPSLWDMYRLLSDVLAKCHKMRGTGTRLRAETRVELGKILTGQSVVFDLDESSFAERDLLAARSNELRISIDTLLSRMRSAYEPIRNGVAQVEDVLRRLLPRIDAVDATFQKAVSDADALRVRVPELDGLDRRIADIRRRSTEDPLSIDMSEGDELESLVRLASNRVAAMRQSRDELQADLAATSNLLAEIRGLRARAASSREKALRATVRPLGLVQVPGPTAIDGPGGLAGRLDPILDATSAWQNVRAELDIWLGQARRLRDQLERAERVNRDPLEKRSELRGRLNAYRAKMAGTGRAEDIVLSEIADEAHTELYTEPTDNQRAERLVSDLGRRLAS